MIMLICAVFDEKVKAFTPPFCVRTRGEAERGFIDACHDKTLSIGQHPEDFALYEIGKWSDTAGVVEAISPLQLLINGRQALSVRKEA